MTAPNGRGRGAPRVAQWRRKAQPIWRAPSEVACRGEDTGLFYKGEEESPGERESRTKKARGLCGSCLFSAECLEAAMEEERGGGGRYGIRGGRTERERRDLQASRTLKAKNERKQAEKAAEEAA